MEETEVGNRRVRIQGEQIRPRCVGWMPKGGFVIAGCRGVHLHGRKDVLVDPGRDVNRRSYAAREWLHRHDGKRAIPIPIAFSRTGHAMKALVPNKEPLVVRDHVMHGTPLADARESTSTIERKPALGPRPLCHQDLPVVRQFSSGFEPVVPSCGQS